MEAAANQECEKRQRLRIVEENKFKPLVKQR
jgi:hypothetical protein